MPRPTQDKETGTWHSKDFSPAEPSPGPGNYPTVEWTYAEHGRNCPLGYNAVTALVMPRPIGWISTYRKEGKIPHIAPYSFFTDVSRRGKSLYVAFSGNRPDEGATKKDAQTNVEETGCFAYNMVSEELAVQMNYCAAPLPREESEFALAELDHARAKLVDAPVVSKSKVHYECTYVRTVNLENWSIVIGKVEGVFIDPNVLSEETGEIDVIRKLRPVTRMGYMDEYGVLPQQQT